MPADPLSFLGDELARLDEQGLRRQLRHLASGQEPEVVVDGREILLFSSNDYLGLAKDARLVRAAGAAMDRYGVGAGSARLICGHMEAHRSLETRLAAFKGAEDALVFSSGYLANIGTIPALVRSGDAVFSDELNHASIVDGVRLAKARRRVYPHSDAEALDQLLAADRCEHPGARALVVTDSVFSMDGHLAPLPDLVEVCEEHDAMLMVDEAHATGVVGPCGRGAVAHFGLEGRVAIVMGTLSKALGAAGGFVAGRRELCEFLRNKARGFIFDTALPPAIAAAGEEALCILEREPALGADLCASTRMVHGELLALGYTVGEPDAAILAIPIGDSRAAVEFSQGLLEHEGILVPAIRPPTVPEGGSRLRLTMSSAHHREHIDRLVAAFAERRPV